MAHRLTLDERRIAASLMEVHQSPSHVQHLLRIQFGRDPPSRLTLRRLYGKFVKTGSVANNNKGNSSQIDTSSILAFSKQDMNAMAHEGINITKLLITFIAFGIPNIVLLSAKL